MDATHAFNGRAYTWWTSNASYGWASCPLTENGYARVLINPSYSPSRRFALTEVIETLTKFAAGTNHEFWSDDLTLRDAKTFSSDRIHGSRQITDLYLLALAVKHGGRLVTFDQNLSISAVKKVTADNLWVL